MKKNEKKVAGENVMEEMEMENAMEAKEMEMENAMEVKEMEMEMEKRNDAAVELMWEDIMEKLRGTRWDNEKIKALRAFVKGLKLERGEEGGRKEELIDLLNIEGRLSIKDISNRMGISAKNVSSLLMYLKKDGVRICTDCEGRKFIEK